MLCCVAGCFPCSFMLFLLRHTSPVTPMLSPHTTHQKFPRRSLPKYIHGVIVAHVSVPLSHRLCLNARAFFPLFLVYSPFLCLRPLCASLVCVPIYVRCEHVCVENVSLLWMCLMCSWSVVYICVYSHLFLDCSASDAAGMGGPSGMGGFQGVCVCERENERVALPHTCVRV